MDGDILRTLTDALVEQLPIGVILTDRQGDMVYVNSAAEQIRCVRREALLGHNVLNCHGEKSRENVRRALEHIMAKPKAVFKRMVDDTAKGRYYVNTYAGLTDTEGNAIGLAVISEDVTEKRKLELERATGYQMMEETSNALRQKYHELLLASLETVAKMLETRDAYTCDHSRNVCGYALKMYEHRYGVGNEYHILRNAATLHDIGKIGIPDTILHKPGKLTSEEYEIIKTHSVIAEAILKPLDSGSSISDIVRHHHEHYDGSGYPDGIKGEAIPQASRIIAIADAYDAMRSNRPYRKALPLEKCLFEIRAHAGSQFDPAWAEVLLELANTGSL